MKKLHPEPPKGKGGNERNPLLVSLTDAGRMLGVSKRTIRRMCQRCELPPIVKVGKNSRVSYQSIIDYIDHITGNNPGGLA